MLAFRRGFGQWQNRVVKDLIKKEKAYIEVIKIAGCYML